MSGQSKSKFIHILIGFLCGASLLISFSFIQKIIAGFNPVLLKGYIIPFLFGGSTGGLIGAYIYKIKDLNKILAQRVTKLEAFLPICSKCKKIRKSKSDPFDQRSWQQLESYISSKTESEFTHSLCPDCNIEIYGEGYSKTLTHNENNSNN